ncbi:hypothetical protein IR009_12130 [Pseudomonas putida]|uniref:hypothetical protein n=1 Tax=Pseudomonas putida TaxID=303 RepID=UPI0018AB97E9|nr:hypothetical protein [Pseudomonas putida]MBF8765971.1 hypothetical protein [Pseudomonas putida]
MSNDSPRVVYEDDFVRVICKAGQSDFMLVTFGNLINLADGMRFFGDTPAEKLNLSCIGFMAKSPNWFPKESVSKAIDAVNYLLNEASEIITYGGSMGGYAAIKYSSALRAKLVIAFCPQWTIDKGECDGRNPGFQEYFEPSLERMGIESNDISGRVFLFFDPKHANDSYHAEMIRSKALAVEYIYVRSVGHLVTGALSGTSNMEKMIELSRAGDLSRLRQLVDKARRKHPIRIEALLHKLSHRHPYLLNKVLQNPCNVAGLKVDVLNALRVNVVNAASAAGRYEIAVNNISLLQSSDICPVRFSMLGLYKQELESKIALDRFAVRTHHGTYLAYSAVDGALVHKSSDEISSTSNLVPVRVIRYAGLCVFGLCINGKFYLCQILSGKKVKLGDIHGVSVSTHSLISFPVEDKKRIEPQWRGIYVTAEKDGTVAYTRRSAKDWEVFHI